MTASDRYTDTTLHAGAGAKVAAGLGAPGNMLILSGTYEKGGSADGDGSVLRLGTVPANAVPVPTLSRLNNDALAGATDIDIGLYKQGEGGAVVDKDILTDGIDINAGNASGSPIYAFQGVGIDKYGQDLRTLVGGSVGDGNDNYDIAITGNTFGTASGTISWNLVFLLPQS